MPYTGHGAFPSLKQSGSPFVKGDRAKILRSCRHKIQMTIYRRSSQYRAYVQKCRLCQLLSTAYTVYTMIQYSSKKGKINSATCHHWCIPMPGHVQIFVWDINSAKFCNANPSLRVNCTTVILLAVAATADVNAAVWVDFSYVLMQGVEYLVPNNQEERRCASRRASSPTYQRLIPIKTYRTTHTLHDRRVTKRNPDVLISRDIRWHVIHSIGTHMCMPLT